MSTLRAWRMVACGIAGLAVLGVGCSSSRDPFVSNKRTRPPAEAHLARPIRVSALHVLPGGQVAAVVAGESPGLFVSPDGESGWAKRNASKPAPRGDAPPEPAPILSVAWDSDALWGLTARGLVRSDDLGKTWREDTVGADNVLYRLFASASDLWSADRTGGLSAVRNPKRLPDARVVTAVLSLPSRELLVATFGRGVVRSIDEGATWTPSGPGLENLDATALASLGGKAVLAGTFGGGVARSEDGGATWTASSEGLEDMEVQALAHDGAGTVLAGAQRGLFRSSDRGRTWKRALGPVGRDNVQAVAFDRKGAPLVGTWGNGLLRSADRGVTWEALSITGDAEDFGALAATREGVLLVGTRAGRVYRLAEDGSGWAELGGRVGNLEILQLARSDRGTTFAGTSAGLYRLAASGTTWETVDVPTGKAPVWRLVAARDGALFLGAVTTKLEGLWASSDDGKTWTLRTDECLRSLLVTQLSANVDGSVLLVACRCLSRDGGRTWTPQETPHGEICLVDVNGQEAAAAGSNNWSSIGVDVGSAGPTLASGQRFKVERRPSCMAVAPGGEVFLVDSKRVEAVRPGAPEPETRATGDFSCRRLLVAPKGALFMASEVGLQRSTDRGRTWARVDGLERAKPPTPATIPDAGVAP